ncbi:MAG: DUF2292 domain-containing protein [Armatimonadota bacterium]
MTPATPPPEPADPIPWSAIEAAIRSVRHGTVQLQIRDGIVVQIDRTEKIRLR